MKSPTDHPTIPVYAPATGLVPEGPPPREGQRPYFRQVKVWNNDIRITLNWCTDHSCILWRRPFRRLKEGCQKGPGGLESLGPDIADDMDGSDTHPPQLMLLLLQQQQHSLSKIWQLAPQPYLQQHATSPAPPSIDPIIIHKAEVSPLSSPPSSISSKDVEPDVSNAPPAERPRSGTRSSRASDQTAWNIEAVRTRIEVDDVRLARRNCSSPLPQLTTNQTPPSLGRRQGIGAPTSKCRLAISAKSYCSSASLRTH